MQAPIDLARLRAIVALPGTRAWRLVDDLREHGVPVRIGVEAAHREAVRPLVLQGTGVALMTQAWADLARGAGALVLDLVSPSTCISGWCPGVRRSPRQPGHSWTAPCGNR